MLSLRTIARPASQLALAASLLVSALGPPTSGGVAAAAAPHGPVARLQIYVKQIHIHSDRELFGKGEMDLEVRIWRCKEELPLPCSGQEYDLSAVADEIARLEDDEFSASSGDTVTRGVVVPWGRTGFAVNDGQRYVVRFDMEEHDRSLFAPGDMGKVVHVVDNGEHGLGLGTYTVRSYSEERYGQGDYTLTYEIRYAPLPDLRPVGIKVHDLLGSPTKLVCATVENAGVANPGPFGVTFRVDGNVPPGGTATAGQLVSGTGGDLCAEIDLPNAGQRQLSAMVDEAGSVLEHNETNNYFEKTYTVPAQAGSAPAQQDSTGKTATTPGASQADLAVSAIKVNGQVPDGKNDCKDGKNRVAVVVKNTGTAHAASFAVRLDVDGQQRDEALLSGLVAGQEQEVRFDDVRLKKGERTLLAIADPNKAVAEANDGNNELKVTATCKADD